MGVEGLAVALRKERHRRRFGLALVLVEGIEVALGDVTENMIHGASGYLVACEDIAERRSGREVVTELRLRCTVMQRMRPCLKHDIALRVLNQPAGIQHEHASMRDAERTLEAG